MVAAAAALAVAAFATWYALDQVLGRSLGAQLVSVGAGLVSGAVAYLAVCRLLGLRELRAVRELRRRD
jgi:hypothetical protein